MTTAADTERVDTLIIDLPDTDATTMPRFNPKDSAWTMAAKLGRHWLHGHDTDMLRDDAERLASAIWPGSRPLTDDDTRDSVLGHFARQAAGYGPVAARMTDDGTAVFVAAGTLPARMLGRNDWHMRRARDWHRHIIGARLATLLGAWTVTHDPDVSIALARQCDRGWRAYDMGLASLAFLAKVGDVWNAETNRTSNRRWRTGGHIAGVFEDLKDNSRSHLAAAAGSGLASRFAHVEIDPDVDLDRFHALDGEFTTCEREGRLPIIAADNTVRFRKTGRHRAIGVYSPDLHALAIDPRAPRSTLHEMMHAWDFEHGQPSCGPDFAPLLDIQREGLARMNLTDHERAYGTTPTEAFARAGEIHAIITGRTSSFTSPSLDALLESDRLCRPLAEHADMVRDMFDRLSPYATAA